MSDMPNSEDVEDSAQRAIPGVGWYVALFVWGAGLCGLMTLGMVVVRMMAGM